MSNVYCLPYNFVLRLDEDVDPEASIIYFHFRVHDKMDLLFITVILMCPYHDTRLVCFYLSV